MTHELKEADAAIITIGRQAGEGLDRKIDGEFNLSQQEQDMIFRVSDQFHAAGKPVIVIINSGSVMETCSWRDRVDAILCAWQPGEEGGNSVADVLTGKANPSGKLTMTWPVAATDHPSTRNFPKEYDMYSYKEMLGWGAPIQGEDFTNHEEDIYVGEACGLSLRLRTELYHLRVLKACGEVKCQWCHRLCHRQEHGQRQRQRGGTGVCDRPQGTVAETRSRTESLQTLTMQIAVRDLASFDEANSQWLAEAGSYTFHIGSSSRDLPLSATIKLKQYTEQVNNAMAPRQPLNLLKQ